MFKVLVTIGATALLVALLLFSPAERASAEIDSDGINCNLVLNADGAPVNARDVISTDTDDAIVVAEGQSIDYVATTDSPVSKSAIYLIVSGFNVPLRDDRQTTSRWSGVITPDEYSSVGTGLHRVAWKVSGPDGKCTATVLFKREGSVFDEPIGVAATLSLFFGGAALMLSIGNATVARLTLTVRVIFGGKKKRREDEHWLCRLLKPQCKSSLGLTVVTTLSGFLLGGGLTVLAQQSALSLISVDLVLKVMLPSTAIPPLLQGLTFLDRTIYESEL